MWAGSEMRCQDQLSRSESESLSMGGEKRLGRTRPPQNGASLGGGRQLMGDWGGPIYQPQTWGNSPRSSVGQGAMAGNGGLRRPLLTRHIFWANSPGGQPGCSSHGGQWGIEEAPLDQACSLGQLAQQYAQGLQLWFFSCPSNFNQILLLCQKFHNFDHISQFWPHVTILIKFQNSNQISQFWPNFTILTKFHNFD